MPLVVVLQLKTQRRTISQSSFAFADGYKGVNAQMTSDLALGDKT